MYPKYILGKHVDTVLLYVGVSVGIFFVPFVIIIASAIVMVRGAWRLTFKNLGD